MACGREAYGWVLGLILGAAIVGCSGGDDDDGSTLSTGGGATGGSGGSGGVILGGGGVILGSGGGGSGTGVITAGDTSACGECAAQEGCVVAHITRDPDVSLQPWTVWPDEADGAGALMVSVRGGGSVYAASLPGADLTPAAADYEVPVCVPAGTGTFMAFLDDDGDAAPDADYSGDYLDSCAEDRQLPITVTAAATLTVSYVLKNSCD